MAKSYAVRRKPAAGVKRMSSKDVENVLARKVMKLERTIRLRAPEEKFFDTALSALNIVDTTGAVQSLVGVAQGSDFNNRIGDSIRIHRIEGHVRIATGLFSVGAFPTGEEFLRCNIVLDRQQVSDTAPTVATIFPFPAEPHNNLLNEATSHHRFKILKSGPLWNVARLSSLATPVATAFAYAPTETGVWNFNHICNYVISYNGSAGTDIEKNGIYMTWRSSIAADTADCDGRVRVYYTDL